MVQAACKYSLGPRMCTTDAVFSTACRDSGLWIPIGEYSYILKNDPTVNDNRTYSMCVALGNSRKNPPTTKSNTLREGAGQHRPAQRYPLS